MLILLRRPPWREAFALPNPGWRARVQAYSITPGPSWTLPLPHFGKLVLSGDSGGIPRLSVGVHGPMPIRSHLDRAPPPPRQAWCQWCHQAWGLTHAPCCSDMRHDRMGKGSRHPIWSHPLTSLRIAEARLLEHEALIQRRGGLIAVIDPIGPSLHQP